MKFNKYIFLLVVFFSFRFLVANEVVNNCDNQSFSNVELKNCQRNFNELNNEKITQELQLIISSYNPKQKELFLKLKSIAYDYFDLKSANEIDNAGTIAGLLYLKEQNKQREDFLKLIKGLEGNIFKNISNEEISNNKKHLDELYKKVLSSYPLNANKEYGGQIVQEQIIKTQENWVDYKKAFLIFAKQTYKNYNPKTIEYLLIKQRIIDLQSLIN
jgi:hypothetical protein